MDYENDNAELFNRYRHKPEPKIKVKLKKHPRTGYYTVKFNGEEIDEAKNKIMSYKIAITLMNSIKNDPKYKGFSNYLKVEKV